MTIAAAELAQLEDEQLRGAGLPPEMWTADEITVESTPPPDVRYGWLRGWEYRYEVTLRYSMDHDLNGVARRPQKAIFSSVCDPVVTIWNPEPEDAEADSNPF